MQRRDFLKILAVAASAAALPAIAMQAPIHPHQKYIDALVLYDNVIVAKNELGPYLSATPEAREKFANVAEAFYAFTMANFTPPVMCDEVLRDCKLLLDNLQSGSADAQLRSVPPIIAEMVWPIAASRALLSEHRTPLNPKTMPSFGKFVDVYKDIIVRSQDLKV